MTPLRPKKPNRARARRTPCPTTCPSRDKDPDRPAWQGSPGVDDHTNTAYYWLPREQPWFAFDRTGMTTIDTSATMPPEIFRRNTWAEKSLSEYPLIGGRGIMTNLKSSRTAILRWVRPLTYPGDLRRDAR